MKEIEGKARRVEKYDRMFFWYVPACAAVMTLIGLAAFGWDWRVLFMLGPGVLVGGVLGVALRDVP